MTSLTEAAVLSTIKTALREQPRSLQQGIGPSELGNECEHCLAAKLAGWVQHPQAAWLPAIGTFVHTALAEIFERHPDRYLVETRVMVGRLGDKEVWGSSDLYDKETDTVVDYKIVGATTLKAAAKTGPTRRYFTQAHAYGTGFANAGYPVKRVAICYLPRNALSLDFGVWWEAHYDPSITTLALNHAEAILWQIEGLRAVDPAAVPVWIGGLPRAKGCFDCARYADAPHDLADLVGV